MAFSVSLHRGIPAVRVPAKHRAAKPVPPLAKKERTLARCESGAESVIATDQALLVGDRDGSWRRFDWASVASATWSPVDNSLTMQLWPHGDATPRRVQIRADRRIAATADERVQFHRILAVPVELPGGDIGHVVAVRVDDEVRWHVWADASVDSPAVRQACAAAIAEIRSLAGL